MKSVNMFKQILTAITLIAFVSASAREKQGDEARRSTQHLSEGSARVMAACTGAKESKELWVNNVRTIIYTGGDMWWDLFGSGNAFYGVPGSQDKSAMPNSLFAGSIWVGGLDAGGQLKVAAMTYRQTGYDFWPGPLDTTNASTDKDVCNMYDKIFYMTRAEVENHVFNKVTSDAVKNWPGNPLDPTKPHDLALAPFKDLGGDGSYDPDAGDYPDYDVKNLAEKDNLGVCKARLYGDATLWWVFNDKGDIHTETGGQSIGLEIRAQAFGFKTNDDINNMTFYNYEVINRSSFSLNKTYFTVWTDADLGNYQDDYVGCDIAKGLGFIYNADGNDNSVSGAPGYGEFPAACGCDFFKGPLADPFDGKDNDGDGVDEKFEFIGMAKFLYYNNNIGSFPPQTTNPDFASHYYGYMTGFWKDNSPFTSGGNAYGGSTPVDYVYPGELYPVRTGWNEFDAGNLAGDRRFLQSAGPFTLLPGAVNNVTFGMPWARSPVKNGNLFAVSLLKVADEKAQALFDNCFKILDGPEAPDMTIQESNNELLIYLTNKSQSNNYLNSYSEKDVTILGIPGQTVSCLSNPDQYYRFEGYKVYQLKEPSVSQTDLDDETKAKLVFQCDVKNGVSRLVNYSFDGSIGADVPKVKVDGADEGIFTTFKVTEDAFATTNKKLINNKTYYFMAVAYAYNNYATYRPDTDPTTNPCAVDGGSYLGQKRPYLEGRKTKKAAGIPHLFDSEKDGTVIQSVYGYGPKITRIEGQGNGGNVLDLTDESVNTILANGYMAHPTYQNGRGPISVKVVDPLNIPNTTFTVKFMKVPLVPTTTVSPITYSIATDPTVAPVGWTSQSTLTPAYNFTAQIQTAAAVRADSVTWLLTNVNTNDVYYPSRSIKIGQEYYFDKIGLSVNIQQISDPGTTITSSYTNVTTAGDLLEATMTFADPLKQWLSGLEDTDDPTSYNWIRSGSKTDQTPTDYNDYETDPDKVFAKILNGTWAPYNQVSYTNKAASGGGFEVMAGPGYNGQLFATTDALTKPNQIDTRHLASVDVVITPDKSKWTRCVVLEMQDDSLLAEGRARHWNLRRHASVDKNGNTGDGVVSTTNPDDADYIGATGMSWFPGYAINLETGERLNMAFGEDSYNFQDNGADMLWNPTANISSGTYNLAWGGRHYIYVFGHNKDAVYGGALNAIYNANLPGLAGMPMGAGRYDACKKIYDQMKMANSIPSPNLSVGIVSAYAQVMKNVLFDAMWVNIPLLKNSSFAFKDPSNLPCEAKVRIRIRKSYRYGNSAEWSHGYRQSVATSTFVGQLNSLPGGVGNTYGYMEKPVVNYLTIDTAASQKNFNMPMYEFSTADIYTMIGESTAAKNALDYVRVVPNPYYGYSKYETNRIDNRVRITNLPNVCTVKIFTMNGTLVRTFKRDVSGQEDDYTNVSDIRQSKRSPYLDWDLKNQYGIPIASGLYIIHVDAPGIGEKILKWFGVMRPLDLTNY